MANITRASLDANTLTNFPDNNTNFITPALLRAWLDDAVDSFVTQKDKSTLENAIYENEGSALTAAATINLASASGNYLHITGAFNGVNSFGICPAGARFILVFDGVCTLTDSATLVLPGGSDITTAAGDCAMLVSEGSGSWRMVGFFPISGGGGGGDITAVTAGTGLSGGGTSGAVTLNLANTAVTPAAYTNANITVDQQGRITAASSGTAGTVSSVDLTMPSAFAVSGNPITTSGILAVTGAGLASQYIRGDGTLANFPGGTVSSVDLTMPSAFAVSGNPITTSGILAVTGAGLASQYVRGDGTLANFPAVTGGGSSVSYYLNGSVTQLTIGGTTYYQMSKTPIFGAGTNFTRTSASGNGYIASFITDANDPNILSIPGGNFNIEFYFNASSGGGSPAFYAELYRYDGASLTLITSGSTNPEGITNGTTVDSYFTSISVPTTAMALTDRLAVRVYVIPSGRNITLHTEDNNLCQVITTISTGLTALNGLTAQVQTFATGTSGTDFAISSVSNTHTFNIPNASSTSRGLITASAQTLGGVKTFGNGASAGEIRLLEGSGSGTNYVALKAAATLAGDTSYTLPSADGTSGFVLQTNGAGSLSWVQNGGAISSAYLIDSTVTQVTGTTSETLLKSILIPANTFSSNSSFRVQFRIYKPNGGTFAGTYRLYVNTSNAIGGTQVNAITLNASGFANSSSMFRSFLIVNQANSTILTGLANSTEPDNSAGSYVNINMSWAVNQYLIISATNNTTGGISQCVSVQIIPQ